MADLTLGSILTNANRYHVSHFLYLPMDEVWQLTTRSAILPQSEIDGVPELAQKEGLSYALQVSAIHEIVRNATLQLRSVNPAQLLQAFLYYYDRDAFINFNAYPDQ